MNEDFSENKTYLALSVLLNKQKLLNDFWSSENLRNTL